MGYLDLLFLASALLSVLTLLAAAAFALFGRRRRALTIVKVLGLYAAVYAVIALGMDAAQPQRLLQIGDPWCFDHWCLTVDQVERAPAQASVAYTVKFRISNSSTRVVQWAPGAWIYLIDDKGRLFPPDDDPSALPLDTKLEPLQALPTQRVFHVSPDATGLGLITNHGGTYCGLLNVVVIGQASCLFNRPTMVVLASP